MWPLCPYVRFEVCLFWGLETGDPRYSLRGSDSVPELNQSSLILTRKSCVHILFWVGSECRRSFTSGSWRLFTRSEVILFFSSGAKHTLSSFGGPALSESPAVTMATKQVWCRLFFHIHTTACKHTCTSAKHWASTGFPCGFLLPWGS